MDYLKINREAWDKRTAIHVGSKFYDIPVFVKGESSLNPIELAQVGEVKGKTLLHLQCHFGLDSLSWARRGARVTGVDISPKAIAQAKRLSDRLHLPAEFFVDDIYHFGQTNTKRFDIVFASYGVLSWLPDLRQWATVIAKSLRVDGQFNLVEFHPLSDLLAGYSYFPKIEPDIEAAGTYTENCTGEELTMVTWSHSLAEVISSLIEAGISIEDFQEYPYSPYRVSDNLEYIDGQGYQLLHLGQQVPLIYAIRGRKSP